MPDIDQVPLCFGAITYYSQDSDRCKRCAAVSSCGPVVEQRTQEVLAKHDIAAVLARHRELKQRANRARRERGASDKTRPQALETGAVVSTPTQPISNAPAVNLAVELHRFIATIKQAGPIAELRLKLRSGIIPFDKEQKELYVISKLVFTGFATSENVKKTLTALGVHPMRIAAAWSAFSASDLAELTLGRLTLKENNETPSGPQV